MIKILLFLLGIPILWASLGIFTMGWGVSNIEYWLFIWPICVMSGMYGGTLLALRVMRSVGEK